MKTSTNDYLSRESLGYKSYSYGYDTVDMVVYQKDAPDSNFLTDVPQFLSEASMTRDEDGYIKYIKGKLGSLDVYINSFCVKIHGSLSAYCHGTNLELLSLQDTRTTLREIGETLNLALESVVVSRLDIAANIPTELQVKAYYPLLFEYKRSQRVQYGKGGIYFKSKKQELSFYDKNQEMKRVATESLIRYELKLRHLGKVLNRRVIATELYDPIFWNQMLALWYSCYLDIKKISKGTNDFSQVTSLKDLYNKALRKCYCNDPTMLDQLEMASNNGFINKNTSKAVRKKLKNIICSPLSQEKNEQIKELDNKMKDVVEQFKVQI